MSHDLQDSETENEESRVFFVRCPHCSITGSFAVVDPDGTVRCQNCGGTIS